MVGRQHGSGLEWKEEWMEKWKEKCSGRWPQGCIGERIKPEPWWLAGCALLYTLAAKWGVWWSSKANTWAYNEGMYQSPHDALRSLTDGLSALLEAAAADDFANLDAIGDQQLGINRNSLRAKPLFMYFPDKFLPISNPAHLANLLQFFGQEPAKGLHARRLPSLR